MGGPPGSDAPSSLLTSCTEVCKSSCGKGQGPCGPSCLDSAWPNDPSFFSNPSIVKLDHNKQCSPIATDPPPNTPYAPAILILRVPLSYHASCYRIRRNV